VIDHYVQAPTEIPDRLRMFQVLNSPALGHRVTFIPDNLANVPHYHTELQKRGLESAIILKSRTCVTTSLLHGSISMRRAKQVDFARNISRTSGGTAAKAGSSLTRRLHSLRAHREAQVTVDPKAREKARQKEETGI